MDVSDGTEKQVDLNHQSNCLQLISYVNFAFLFVFPNSVISRCVSQIKFQIDDVSENLVLHSSTNLQNTHGWYRRINKITE